MSEREAAEREFIKASVAVWREVERLEAIGPYPGIPPKSELRLREREAWERYRPFLQHPYYARRLGRLILTTCRQGEGAPIVDRAWTHDREGNRYSSVAILLTPWRKNRYGEHRRQRALVIGWRTA